MDAHDLDAGLAALSMYFVGGATMAETLQRVADLATGAVAPAPFAGMTMMVDERPRTAVFTD